MDSKFINKDDVDMLYDTSSADSVLLSSGLPCVQVADENLVSVLTKNEHKESQPDPSPVDTSTQEPKTKEQSSQTTLEFEPKMSNPKLLHMSSNLGSTSSISTFQYLNESSKSDTLLVYQPANAPDFNPQPERIVRVISDSEFPFEQDGDGEHSWLDIGQSEKPALLERVESKIRQRIQPDMVIRIGDCAFNVHLLALQSYSEFFDNYNGVTILELPDGAVTPRAFQLAYDWMIKEDAVVGREGIMELLKAATFLRMTSLVSQCWMCLDDTTCCGDDQTFSLYLEAHALNLKPVEKIMLQRVSKYFLPMVSSREFLHMTPHDICMLFKSSNIAVNTEIEVFYAAVLWLQQDWKARKSITTTVMNCIRFSLMPVWFLVGLHKSPDCIDVERITTLAPVQRMIIDGLTYTTLKMQNNSDEKEFKRLIERCGLTQPCERVWLYSKHCKYHSKGSPDGKPVTYKAFLDHLTEIRNRSFCDWDTIEVSQFDWKSKTNVHPSME